MAGGDVNLGAKLEGLDDLRVDDLDEDEHRQVPTRMLVRKSVGFPASLLQVGVDAGDDV